MSNYALLLRGDNTDNFKLQSNDVSIIFFNSNYLLQQEVVLLAKKKSSFFSKEYKFQQQVEDVDEEIQIIRRKSSKIVNKSSPQVQFTQIFSLKEPVRMNSKNKILEPVRKGSGNSIRYIQDFPDSQLLNVPLKKTQQIHREEFLKKMKEFSSDRNRKTIQVWQFDQNNENDIVFMRDFAAPYFSAVYQVLLEQNETDHLTIEVIRQYFNLPELLFTRVIKIMNASGDECIDHDEWLKFFLRLSCGSFQHKLHVVFQIFDVSDEEVLKPQNVKLILNHFPLFISDSRYGISFSESAEAQLTRVDLMNEKLKDQKDINYFIDKFFEDNTNGIIFKVFQELVVSYSSELYFAVFNCFQECIPCYRNFLKARANHCGILTDKSNLQQHFMPKHLQIELAYPSLSKSKDRYELEILGGQQQDSFQPIQSKMQAVRKQSAANINTSFTFGNIQQMNRGSIKKKSSAEEIKQYKKDFDQNNPKIQSQQQLQSKFSKLEQYSNTGIIKEESSEKSSKQSEKSERELFFDRILLKDPIADINKSQIKSPKKDLNFDFVQDSDISDSQDASISVSESLSIKNAQINNVQRLSVFKCHDIKKESSKRLSFLLDESSIASLQKKLSTGRYQRRSAFEQSDEIKIEIAKEKDILLVKKMQQLEEVKKNLGFKLELDFKPQVINDFMKNLNPKIDRLSGPTMICTTTGYIKSGWCILTGNELYVYNTKDALAHSKMLILQGAKIKCSPTDEPVEIRSYAQSWLLYKLEILMGQNDEVSTSLYYPKQESLLKWYKALQVASQDYHIDDFYDQYQDQQLGTGTCSIVYKGFNKKTKQEVAIRKIQKETEMDFSKELYIRRLGVHHYVGRLLDYFNSKDYFYMVLECENGGTLAQYISSHSNCISEQRTKEIVRKIAQGIEFLHEYGILIGLLNLNTILMTDTSEQALPRISNLSKASILLPFHKTKDKLVNGQECNYAPEILSGQAYDQKVDTWSFGTILYILLGGQYNLRQKYEMSYDPKQLYNFKLDLQPLLQRRISTQAIDLVQKCLCNEPTKRISVNAVLKHGWFKES